MPSEILSMAFNVLIMGLVYSFVVMGVYLSSRVIRFEDLTTEGSFGLGGALAAVLVVSDVSAWVALFLATVGGACAGTLTGVLHTRFNMNNLISGLVVTTALFSVCLKLAGANLMLPPAQSIFSLQESGLPLSSIAILGLLVGAIYLTLKKLLVSEIGLFLRAAGENPQMLISLGKNVAGYKTAGLALSNSLTALGGAVFVLWNGYFSIMGGVGTLVIGLAGLVLAEMIQPKFSLSLILGAILYQSIFAMTIEFELDPVWNNLIKATLIVLLIYITKRKHA